MDSRIPRLLLRRCRLRMAGKRVAVCRNRRNSQVLDPLKLRQRLNTAFTRILDGVGAAHR